jgi:hypothetical protein
VGGALLIVVALLAGLPGPPGPIGRGGQRSHEEALEEFKQERFRVLHESGQRHLEYGLELRKKGLRIQAAAQIVLSVDVSRGRNGTARYVLELMRSFEDGFWRRRPAPVTPAKLAAYWKEADELRARDLADRVALVRWAAKRDLEQQAYEELREVLLETDEPLAFDAKGRLVVGKTELDPALSDRVRADAIEINGLPYVRDTFLRRVPQVKRVFEKSTPELRVRSTTSVEEAEHVHAACAALLPVLDADLGLAPGRRLQVIVIGERAHYNTYLDLADLSSHRAADGFADRVAATAVLCREGSDDAHVLGLALHELAHLHQLSVTPTAFPSWYREGWAESFGGTGTFTFDGTTLETRLPMSAARLAEVRAAPFPLRELLDADALALLAADKTAARRYYAQSWAFLRFLEQGAGSAIAERLERWRSMCLGAVLGADLYEPYAMDATKSQALFDEYFATDLARLEQEFGVWLAAQ